MNFGVALVFGLVVTVLLVGGLFAPTPEGREMYRTGAAVLAFWLILLAALN